MKKVNHPQKKRGKPPQQVRANSLRRIVRTTNKTRSVVRVTKKKVPAPVSPQNPFKLKLDKIHTQLRFQGGSMKQEYPEQLLTLEYLPDTAKVLEIGGNLGRNSLIISTVLQNDRDFVSLECDPRSVKQLIHNRDVNNRNFHIEGSALSKTKLFQKGWCTFTEANKPAGAFPVSTITWSELQTKYNIAFDTLIADCEGALYYILNDFPDFLDKMTLIIVENDYSSLAQKQMVDKAFAQKGFFVIASRPGPSYTPLPCRPYFYQVWKKMIIEAV